MPWKCSDYKKALDVIPAKPVSISSPPPPLPELSHSLVDLADSL